MTIGISGHTTYMWLVQDMSNKIWKVQLFQSNLGQIVLTLKSDLHRYSRHVKSL